MCRWALLFTALAMDVQAESPHGDALQVNWKGPVECGSADSLELETRKLLGTTAQSTDVIIDAQAQRLESGTFRIELILSGTVSGVRSLESRDCQEAIQASAVVLALAINPSVLTPSSEPESSPQPSSSPPSEVNSTSSAPAPSADTFLLLGLEARLSGGLSPWPSWGAAARLGFSHGLFLGSIQPYVLPGSWQSFEGEVRTKILQSGFDTNLCAAFLRRPRMHAHVCAGLALAFLSAKSEGLESAETQTAFVLAPRLGLNLRTTLFSSLSLVTTGTIELPTTHPDFIYADENGAPHSVHQVNWGGAVSAGLEWALPVF